MCGAHAHVLNLCMCKHVRIGGKRACTANTFRIMVHVFGAACGAKPIGGANCIGSQVHPTTHGDSLTHTHRNQLLSMFISRPFSKNRKICYPRQRAEATQICVDVFWFLFCVEHHHEVTTMYGKSVRGPFLNLRSSATGLRPNGKDLNL